MRVTVTGVEKTLNRTGGGELWYVRQVLEDDDGSSHNHAHIFPTDTLEWRAAEYGIDPADTQTLLDIVLAEPHLTEDDYTNGPRLHDAPDIDTAREAHLARCATAKLRHRLSTRVKDGPLKRIHDESPMSAEVIAMKREHVHKARHAVRELSQQAANTTDYEASRVERWRMRRKN